jgi:hypothetical protein
LRREENSKTRKNLVEAGEKDILREKKNVKKATT